MADREFIREFREKKEEFKKHLEKGDFKIKGGRGRAARSSDRLLDWFEKWLAGELVEQQQKRSEPAMPFDRFLNEVFAAAVKMLVSEEPGLGNILEGPLNNGSHAWKCYSKSWKSLYIFEDAEVFYRIGKTTPRKGPHQGQELLVIELVLDGKKKQAFLPMLDRKEELEAKIGRPLEREQPRVEATGKYRFKLYIPYEQAHNGEVRAVAGQFYDFVRVTKPVLNELGIR
ncbi:MAG: hypothetical protein K6T80_06880 [Firmicutes bacterium]|nr:hypothetical protein [Bacillota bacterium]